MNLIFFNSDGELVELLLWTTAIAKLKSTQEEARLRQCCQVHAQWMEESTTN